MDGRSVRRNSWGGGYREKIAILFKSLTKIPLCTPMVDGFSSGIFFKKLCYQNCPKEHWKQNNIIKKVGSLDRLGMGYMSPLRTGLLAVYWLKLRFKGVVGMGYMYPIPYEVF